LRQSGEDKALEGGRKMQKTPQLERGKIIDVAADLFAQKSYAGTSVRDISHALNVSIATIYYYFKNKEDLLFTIIESCGNDLLLGLNQACEESPDALQQLNCMLIRHISLTQEKKNELKLFVEEHDHLSKGFKNIIFKQHRKIYDTYVEKLKELQKLNVIKEESIPIVAFAIFGMVNWCYRWYREENKLPIEEVAQKLTNIFFYGILNTGARSQAAPFLSPAGEK
jgi:AcrR family transcriptional regulator